MISASIKLLLVVCVSLMAACASKTQVQFYTEFLSDKEVVKLADLLRSNNYKVVLNDHPIPPGLTQSTLIYSPLNRDIDQVNRLIDLIGTTPFGIPQVELTGKENHFYTWRTVGLYLLPSAVIAKRSNATPKRYSIEYNGDCETVDASLRLLPDGKFQLSSYEWSDELNVEFETIQEGSWMQVDESLFLSLANQAPVEFSIARRVVDGANSFQMFRLTNEDNDPFFDNCNFYYKEYLE